MLMFYKFKNITMKMTQIKSFKQTKKHYFKHTKRRMTKMKIM